MKNNEFITPNKLFIDRTDVKAARKVLIDNGIPMDEADTVLQAIGYTLLGEELFPEKTDTKEPQTEKTS